MLKSVERGRELHKVTKGTKTEPGRELFTGGSRGSREAAAVKGAKQNHLTESWQDRIIGGEPRPLNRFYRREQHGTEFTEDNEGNKGGNREGTFYRRKQRQQR